MIHQCGDSGLDPGQCPACVTDGGPELWNSRDISPDISERVEAAMSHAYAGLCLAGPIGSCRQLADEKRVEAGQLCPEHWNEDDGR